MALTKTLFQDKRLCSKINKKKNNNGAEIVKSKNSNGSKETLSNAMNCSLITSSTSATLGHSSNTKNTSCEGKKSSCSTINNCGSIVKTASTPDLNKVTKIIHKVANKIKNNLKILNYQQRKQKLCLR